MVFVDTNIFIRYLTGDDPVKYENCKNLFRKAVEGRISLLTSGMVIAEIIWTLQSFYKVPKEEVIEKVAVIINTPNLYITERNIISEALVIYSRKNIDYIDAYNAVFMRHNKSKELFSYDEDFDMIDGIKRREP